MISFEGVNQFCWKRPFVWISASELKLNIVIIKLGVTLSPLRSLLSVGSYSVLVLSHILDVLHNPDFTACCCPPTDPCQPADTSLGLHDKWQFVTAWHGTAPVTSLLLLRAVNSLSDWVWRCLQCKVWTLHCTARPSCCCAAAAIRNKTGSGHQHRDSGAVEPHCTVGTLGTEHEGPWWDYTIYL